MDVAKMLPRLLRGWSGRPVARKQQREASRTRRLLLVHLEHLVRDELRERWRMAAVVCGPRRAEQGCRRGVCGSLPSESGPLPSEYGSLTAGRARFTARWNGPPWVWRGVPPKAKSVSPAGWASSAHLHV